MLNHVRRHSSHLARLLVGFAFLLFLVSSSTGQVAHAAPRATITVMSAGDGSANSANCPGASCRLRDALAKASSGDTINFDSSLSGSTIAVSTGLGIPFQIGTSLTIDGSALSSAVTISGSGAYTIFNISGSVSVIFKNLTLANGRSFSGAVGGAIYMQSSTIVALENSTITGNSGAGYAILNSSGTLTIVNSTFNGNSNGIDDAGATTIVNSTIFNTTGNSVYHSSGAPSLFIKNTIIAGGGGANCAGNAVNAFTNSLSSDTTCSGTATSYMGLGSLASNGGNTQTIALLADSPAIDAGDATICANSPVSGLDQRGQARDDLRCDIGAYEMKIADRNTVTLQPSSSALTTYGPAHAGIQFSGTDPGLTTVTKATNWMGGTPSGTLGVWWQITPVTNTGLNATLKLCYATSELGNLNETGAHFWKHNGSWNDMGAASFTGTSPNRCAQITGVTNFSKWTFANANPGGSAPTAVTLSSFKANAPTFDLVQWFRQFLGLAR